MMQKLLRSLTTGRCLGRFVVPCLVVCVLLPHLIPGQSGPVYKLLVRLMNGGPEIPTGLEEEEPFENGKHSKLSQAVRRGTRHKACPPPLPTHAWSRAASFDSPTLRPRFIRVFGEQERRNGIGSPLLC
jgi:hypothetical protein